MEADVGSAHPEGWNPASPPPTSPLDLDKTPELGERPYLTTDSSPIVGTLTPFRGEPMDREEREQATAHAALTIQSLERGKQARARAREKRDSMSPTRLRIGTSENEDPENIFDDVEEEEGLSYDELVANWTVPSYTTPTP